MGRFPAADVVIGGPPCQGFSPLNMARRRGSSGVAVARVPARPSRAEPQAFVMENVPELLRSGEYVAFAEAAEELGFAVSGRILNAADYGVPQRRRRAIVVGVREGEFEWPEPTHSAGDDPAHRPAVAHVPRGRRGTAARAHGRELAQPAQSATPEPGALPHDPERGRGTVRSGRAAARHHAGCWLRKKTGSTDVFGRLWWDRPAFTIRTEFYKPEKGRYLHPSEHRPITVREAARCMSFPDGFVFPEAQSMTSVAKQIGNAVPPDLARRSRMPSASRSRRAARSTPFRSLGAA